MKFFIMDFFSEYDQIRIFCAVQLVALVQNSVVYKNEPHEEPHENEY